MNAPAIANIESPPTQLAPSAGARVAIVGGCGGIGRALVEACLSCGLDVAVLDLPASLTAVPPPSEARSIAIDATDEAAVSRAFGELATVWPAFDGLVGLAGFMTERTPVDRLTPAQWDHLVDGNLRSAFLVARAALPMLRVGRDPALVFVSSGLAQRVLPGYAGYAASKAGLIALTKAIAVENAPGLRANAVAPGAVDTAFLDGGTGRDRGSAAPRVRLDVSAYVKNVPLGRIATPADVVGPILFLLGPASRYMTGQVLYVNGGGLTP